MQTDFIYERARAFTGDKEGMLFTDAKLSPFLDQAVKASPNFSDRKLAAVVAMNAMVSCGWYEGSECIRRSLQMGLI